MGRWEDAEDRQREINGWLTAGIWTGCGPLLVFAAIVVIGWVLWVTAILISRT